MTSIKGHRGWGHVRQLTNKSKRWQASYIGPDGLRHAAPTTFEKKTDAESWLGKERRLIERDALGEGEWIPPKERDQLASAMLVRLGDYGTKEIARRDLRPRTRDQYETLFNTHIKPVLGNVSLNRISSETVKTWHAKTLVGKPTYRAHAYNLLKSILNTAVNDGLIQSNPCNINGAGKITSDLQINLLTPEQLAIVADKIEPKRFKALVLISAWCGLRYGEATELRRKDFSADLSVVTISRAVTHRKGCHVDTPKSKKRRVVPVPPHIRPAITEHLETNVSKDAESLLFPAPRGGACKHLDDKAFRKAFIPAVKTVGREDVRIHDLRHFGGTMAARVGSSFEAKDYLGHATIQMTERYVHMVSGRAQEMAEKMSALTGWTADSLEE